MITLTISHNLFLTKEERYNLYSGKDVFVVGVNVPVWFHKGATSEPASEVFCNYQLTNIPDAHLIGTLPDGYTINLPQIKKSNTLKKNLGIYRPSPTNLLDVQDGGSGWLHFKCTRKKNIVNNNQKINVTEVHFIEIKPIEVLNNSLTI